MPEVKARAYECPVCGHKSIKTTNHFGEIYSGCNICGSTVLYCIEPEAIEAMKNREKDTAYIFKYYVNLDSTISDYNAEKTKNYKETIEKLEKRFKKFEVISTGFKTLLDYIDEKEEVVVLDKNTFEDQFISNRGRIHRWKEIVYPNKNIKAGYYVLFEGEIL